MSLTHFAPHTDIRDDEKKISKRKAELASWLLGLQVAAKLQRSVC